MGLKDLLNKGKCLIGLHQGEWRAASPASCTFTRVCERCGVEHHKTEHVWPEWRFVAAGACDQERSCGRCGAREERISHAWGQPAYKADGACEQHQVCDRCGASKEAPVRHLMDQWRYVGGDSCTQVQQCSRCHADGTLQRVEHLWGDWQHSNAHNAPVRVCRRCGELQAQAAPPPAARSRQEMFEALKPKMTGLADQQATMERILASLGAEAERQVEAVRTPSAAPDGRLVGHWRCTEVMSSGGFSLVTDIHLVLDGEGRFARWSHSESGMGSNRSEAEHGAWLSRDGTLVLSYDDGAESTRVFQVAQDQLFFPQSGSQRLWERVG